jgi:predicted transcriptional regulator YheO
MQFLLNNLMENSNITGRTVSALLTEELLEKIMLAKTKHKKLWKFYIVYVRLSMNASLTAYAIPP